MNDTAPSPEVADAAASLGLHLTGLFKAIKALPRELPMPVRGLDHAALPLLFVLDSGTHRVSSLADACHADLSTTSRSATALTRLGLVEKTPDPNDRRAQVLAITEAGRDVVAQIRSDRSRLLAAILTDWAPADIHRFVDYLTRFADDVEHHLRPTAFTTKED